MPTISLHQGTQRYHHSLNNEGHDILDEQLFST
jgi:hypothetical protein